MFKVLQSSTRHARSIAHKIGYKSNLTTHLAAIRFKSSQPIEEVVSFPSSEQEEETPVLLNSKEHAVGYLSKILNARVYDACKETELQEAKSLSMVCYFCF